MSMLVQKAGIDLETAEVYEEILQVVANKLRIQILDILAARDGQAAVVEVAELLDVPPAQVSQHLSLMRRYHLVQPRREGRQVYYHLTSPQAWTTIRNVLATWMRDYQGRLDRAGGAGINRNRVRT